MKLLSTSVLLKSNLIFSLKIKMRLITTVLSTLGCLITVQANSQSSPVYEVYAIAFTNVETVDGKWVTVRNNPDSIKMRFIVWLIRGNGKNILIDAGYTLTDSALRVNTNGYIRPDVAVQKLKVNPDDITDVIISHPHWDHIDGIELFPKAKVWMQKDDYDYFVGTAWQKDGQNFGFHKEDVQKIVNVNLQGRLHLNKGDNLEIIPGIRVFIGSRHTYESEYVQVTTGKEKIILASDNIWFYYNFDNLLSASLTFDTTGYVNQMKRMKTLASDVKLIIPGHDGLIFTRFPKVAEGIVRISGNK
jgi:glyoxylase-like metal-dependent hydrolase (beta-lactamase superfamily II)